MRRLFVPPAQLPPAQLDASQVRLTPEQTRYLTLVLRLRAGDELELFDGEGGRYPAQLESGEILRVGARLEAEARALEVVLAQALAKGEKMDLIVQKATELGVARIVPLVAERSVVKLSAERGASRTERFRRIAQEAARQCGRADVPLIDEPQQLEPLLAATDCLCLVLDPAERLRLSAAARGVSRLLLAIGPEGGFSPAELALAQRSGALTVGLGPLVLRTETAGLAALSVLQHLHGALG
jgi:16S rRNA (uracil1498-N3)-methyltransferase